MWTTVFFHFSQFNLIVRSDYKATVTFTTSTEVLWIQRFSIKVSYKVSHQPANAPIRAFSGSLSSLRACQKCRAKLTSCKISVCQKLQCVCVSLPYPRMNWRYKKCQLFCQEAYCSFIPQAQLLIYTELDSIKGQISQQEGSIALEAIEISYHTKIQQKVLTKIKSLERCY